MTSELTKALCAFHQQVGTIHKDAKAQYGKYADLAGVLSTVLPALSKNGLSITQTFDAEKNLITTLTHISGEERSSALPMIVAAGRNELHSWGASVTYMRRYAICSMLCLVADIDTDGNVEDSPTPRAKPKAAPAKTPPASKPAPAATPTDAPLSKEDHGMVLATLKGLEKDTLNQLVVAFKSEFDLAESAKVSSHITTQRHVDFINRTLATLQS